MAGMEAGPGVPLHSAYREYLPPASLAGSVVCFWTQAIHGGQAGVYRQAVLPDGCVDIVWFEEGGAIVAGPATRRVDVDLCAGSRLSGVRFYPGAASRYLGLPLRELCNREICLGHLWGPSAPGYADIFHDRETGRDAFRHIEAELASRAADRHAPDGLVRAAVNWLAANPGGRIRDLARMLDLGERQLHRRFTGAVGYGPKKLQQIMRLQKMLEFETKVGPDGGMADIAAQLGYADQAHMCREVLALTGKTPGGLISHDGSALALSDLFNTADSRDV